MKQSVSVLSNGREIASPVASDTLPSRCARTFLHNTFAMTGYLDSPEGP